MSNKVRVVMTDKNGLEENINKIGYENILKILPSHEYNGTIFVILYYEVEEWNQLKDKSYYLTN